MSSRLEEYVLDTFYACQKFPWGLQRPDVVKGYFADTREGLYQRIMFDELLDLGFRRTPFQMVFPNQTAGLVRTKHDSSLETHIRFYDDGVIAAEVECGRMSLAHWRGERYASTQILDTILDLELQYLPIYIKEGIRKQFSIRDYDCLRSHDPQAENWSVRRILGGIAAMSFVAVQYPLTVFGAVSYIRAGELYYALEPLLLAGVETLALLATLVSAVGSHDDIASQ